MKGKRKHVAEALGKLLWRFPGDSLRTGPEIEADPGAQTSGPPDAWVRAFARPSLIQSHDGLSKRRNSPLSIRTVEP